MTELDHLSYSTIKDLQDLCAYKLALEKHTDLPTTQHPKAAAGIAYHAGIELHEQRRRQADLTDGREGDGTGATYNEMVNAAGAALEETDVDWDVHDFDEAWGWIRTATWHWWHGEIPEGQAGEGGSLRDRVMDWRPVQVEQFWEMWDPASALPVVGAADAMYRTPDDELVVVDHKSTGSMGKYRLDGDGLQDQAAMYRRAAIKALGMPGLPDDPTPRFEYHIARTEEGKTSRFQTCRVVVMEPDAADADYLDRRLQAADQQQAEGRYPKNPHSWICSPKWCPFHVEAGGPCNPTNPQHEVPVV